MYIKASKKNNEIHRIKNKSEKKNSRVKYISMLKTTKKYLILSNPTFTYITNKETQLQTVYFVIDLQILHEPKYSKTNFLPVNENIIHTLQKRATNVPCQSLNQAATPRQEIITIITIQDLCSCNQKRTKNNIQA